MAQLAWPGHLCLPGVRPWLSASTAALVPRPSTSGCAPPCPHRFPHPRGYPGSSWLRHRWTRLPRAVPAQEPRVPPSGLRCNRKGLSVARVIVSILRFCTPHAPQAHPRPLDGGRRDPPWALLCVWCVTPGPAAPSQSPRGHIHILPGADPGGWCLGLGRRPTLPAVCPWAGGERPHWFTPIRHVVLSMSTRRSTFRVAGHPRSGRGTLGVQCGAFPVPRTPVVLVSSGRGPELGGQAGCRSHGYERSGK